MSSWYFNDSLLDLNIIDYVINGTDVQFAVIAEKILNMESNVFEKNRHSV